jgi:membrane fusion protein, copper/silver efflux system
MSTEILPEGVEQPPPGTRVMAVVRWILVAAMALAAVLAVLSWRGAFDGDGDAERSVLYTCPMHPDVVQEGPGQCPICHMSLVPKREKAPPPEQASEHVVPGLAPVELSAERVQAIGVRTAPVRKRAISAGLRTVGVVAADETRLARIDVRIAGWIEKLHVSETGARVKKGQALASIYSPDLVAAQQELLNALSWESAPAGAPGDGPSLTAGLAGDARRRLELLNVSPSDIATVERTRKPLRTLGVRSPVTGTVIRKDAVEGAYVPAGTTLFEVVDLSTVWVLADLYEQDLVRVEPGAVAAVTFGAYPGEVFAGKVDFVYPTLDARTRTVRLRVVLKNPRERLKPGMYGDVALDLPAAEALVIPREALVDTGDAVYVFVARPGDIYEPRRVRPGLRDRDVVQILDGLAEGDVVVTTGNFLIDSESRLRGTAPAPDHSGHGGAP